MCQNLSLSVDNGPHNVVWDDGHMDRSSMWSDCRGVDYGEHTQNEYYYYSNVLDCEGCTVCG